MVEIRVSGKYSSVGRICFCLARESGLDPSFRPVGRFCSSIDALYLVDFVLSVRSLLFFFWCEIMMSLFLSVCIVGLVGVVYYVCFFFIADFSRSLKI